MIRCIDNVDDRDTFWPEYQRVRKHLAAAAAHNRDEQWERNLLNDLLFRKTSTLWTGEHSAAVTWIADYDGALTLTYQLVGGDIDEIMEHGEPIVTEFARERGCKRTAMFGRPGFQRVLPKYGFALRQIVMTKEIDEQ